MKDKTAVRFDDVTFRYGPDKQIISSLNISIPANCITAILGPNGTGKTTFLHLILGWLRPGKGRVILAGRDISSWEGGERGRTLSLLPQKEPANFEYTVLEYLLLGRTPYLKPLQMPGPEDLRIASAAMNTTGITELAEEKLPVLSGGEMQLVLLSRSITQDPEILLLDEPTNHLDLKNRSRMILLLKKFRDQNKTILFTTHDPDLASSLADYLILMGPGGKVKHGPFETMFTEENLSWVYDLPVKVEEIHGRLRVLTEN